MTHIYIYAIVKICLLCFSERFVMPRINQNGRSWDNYNGTDDTMSRSEFRKFWNEEVVKNDLYQIGYMSFGEYRAIDTKVNNYFADGKITKDEFDKLVSETNTALGYRTPRANPNGYAWQINGDPNGDDYQKLDKADGNKDGKIKNKQVMYNYIDIFASQDNYAPYVSDKEIKYIKGIADTLMKDGQISDWVEAGIIDELLKQARDNGSAEVGQRTGSRPFKSGMQKELNKIGTPSDKTFLGLLAKAESIATPTQDQNGYITATQAEALLWYGMNNNQNVSVNERNHILHLLDDVTTHNGGKIEVSLFYGLHLSLMREAQKGKGEFI